MHYVEQIWNFQTPSLPLTALLNLRTAFFFISANLMSSQFEEALKKDKIEGFMNNHTEDLFKTRNKASQSPLMLACAHKTGQAAKLMLQKFTPEQIDLNGTDAEGWMALHYASKSGCLESVKLLLDNGATIAETTNKGATSLHISAEEGQSDIVAFLIDQGAKVDAFDEYQKTPLHRAAANGKEKVCDILLKIGAKIDALDNAVIWESFQKCKHANKL